MNADDNEWVTSREGAGLMGIQQTNFLYYAKTGEIAIKPGTRNRKRLYSRADVLKVRSRLAKEAKRAAPEPPLLDWMYAADVPTGLKLSSRLYPGEVDLAEAAIYQSWRRNNPYLTMAAYSQDRNECYATVQVVPLPEQVILDVLTGRREESSIQPDEILAYDRPGAYNLLVTSATCLPDRPQLLYQVLYKYMHFWLDMYPERYIKRVYAQAVSDSGMKIVQHFFMSPRLDLAYNAFMLDLAYPTPARMISQFKHQLEEKAPLPDDLRWPPPAAAQIHAPAPAPQPATASNLAPTSLPSKTKQATLRPSQRQIQASDKQEMPEGWAAPAAFAKRHGVREATATDAAKNGRLPSHHGDWKEGRARGKYALDPGQQIAWYQFLSEKPNFHQCDVPGCPCHQELNREP